MALNLGQSLKHAWNAFVSDERERTVPQNLGVSYGLRPDRVHFSFGSDRSIVSPIINQIGIDAASETMRHIKQDQNGRYIGTVSSGLDYCLTQEANIDQTGIALMQDAVMTMCENGVAVIVPVDTALSPTDTNIFDVRSLRVGTPIQWYPKHIRIKLYNETLGKMQELVLPKSICAIVENPLYSVMNDTNSTLKRLTRKLALLDAVDEQSGSGKLDIIIQLPYTIRSDEKRKQAEQRRTDIELQLAGSKYGIAYADATEKITQLNRPAENNLLSQVTYLTDMLYSQLGLSKAVFDGTADEKAMLNYHNRTIGPILQAFADEMSRKFLTKTARTQGQTIKYFRDPFKLVDVGTIAEIGDKFTRNAILSSNEVRALLGYLPVNTDEAEALSNKNLKAEDRETATQEEPAVDPSVPENATTEQEESQVE